MKVFAEYKKAHFNFEPEEIFDGGIELLGFEVKAVREGKVTFEGAYIGVRGGEAYLLNAHISPFQQANTPPDYDPIRARVILIKKEEIERLAEAEAKKGLTIIPLSLYSAGRKIKLKFAIAHGKKKYDKRHTLKKRVSDRDIERTLKYQ